MVIWYPMTTFPFHRVSLSSQNIFSYHSFPVLPANGFSAYSLKLWNPSFPFKDSLWSFFLYLSPSLMTGLWILFFLYSIFNTLSLLRHSGFSKGNLVYAFGGITSFSILLFLFSLSLLFMVSLYRRIVLLSIQFLIFFNFSAVYLFLLIFAINYAFIW